MMLVERESLTCELAADCSWIPAFDRGYRSVRARIGHGARTLWHD